MTIRPLHTIAEFREVSALEREVWGFPDPEDAVGIPVFVVTVKRGGILLGAYDGDRLIGFVYSIAGLKDGKPTQWSHMLAVRQDYRATGIGRELKLEQRRISLAMGIDLMEWTFDPLVAVNAHLNFRRLGVIVEEYVENVYGESSSPLHKGAPTDRFVAQWWMRSPRVEAILAGRPAPVPGPEPGEWPVATPVNTVGRAGACLTCGRFDLTLTAPRLSVTIPAAFTDMLEHEPDLARAWRMASREIFSTYLARGYRVVDFHLGPDAGDGVYLLERSPSHG
jgi:predicted GNAT superfamily acetyltransferase